MLAWEHTLIEQVEGIMIRKLSLYTPDGASRLYTLVDQDTYDTYKDVKLWLVGGYVMLWCRVTKRDVYLHRYILNPGTLHVDHVNRDKLDNRRCNLRVVTHSQNMRNKGLQKSNTTGVKGVKVTKYSSYESRLKINGYTISKTFKSKWCAAIYYNLLAQEHHGSYAVVNQLDTITPELYYVGLEH